MGSAWQPTCPGKKEISAIAAPMPLNPGLPLMVVSAAAAAQSIPPEKFMAEVRPQMLATVEAIATRYRAG